MPHPYMGGRAESSFNKPTNLRPPTSDPRFPLRVLQCKEVEVRVVPGQPVLTATFIPLPDTETLVINEPWDISL